VHPKKVSSSSSSSSKSCLIIIIIFFIIILHSFIHFIPIQRSRAWTVRNERRISSFSVLSRGFYFVRIMLLSLLLYWAWKEEALQTNGFWDDDLLRMWSRCPGCATRCPPTDWPTSQAMNFEMDFQDQSSNYRTV
jgi:hypothetical protein